MACGGQVSQVIGWALLCLASSSQLLAADYRFEKIRVPGSIATEAIGVNARGDIVGGYVGRDEVSHGFLLRQGVFTPIDVPGAAETDAARGINARGDIVGGFLGSDQVSHGYLLSDERFTQIDYPGARGTVVTRINNAGDNFGSMMSGIRAASFAGMAGSSTCAFRAAATRTCKWPRTTDS